MHYFVEHHSIKSEQKHTKRRVKRKITSVEKGENVITNTEFGLRKND